MTNKALQLNTFISLVTATLVAAPAFAAPKVPHFSTEAQKNAYFTVKSVSVKPIIDDNSYIDTPIYIAPIIVNPAQPAPAAPAAPVVPAPVIPAPGTVKPTPTTPNAAPAQGGIAAAIGGIIGMITNPANLSSYVQLTQAAWALIEANKPAAHVEAMRVNVLPASQDDWAKLEGFQAPVHQTFLVEATNGLGMKVASYKYTISYNYNGHVNGAGHYIANATVIPSAISVSWGYTLNSTVGASNPVNTTSVTDPLPGVSLELNWSLDSMFKHTQGTESYFVTGDGNIQRVN